MVENAKCSFIKGFKKHKGPYNMNSLMETPEKRAFPKLLGCSEVYYIIYYNLPPFVPTNHLPR